MYRQLYVLANGRIASPMSPQLALEQSSHAGDGSHAVGGLQGGLEMLSFDHCQSLELPAMCGVTRAGRGHPSLAA
jgi:hypothetical protein